MKRINFAFSLFVVVFLIGAVTLFIYQLKKDILLNKIINEKKLEIKNSDVARQHLEELRNQRLTLKEKADMLNNKIPVNEPQPLNLVKELIAVGGKIGLKNLAFDLSGDIHESTPMKSILDEVAPGMLQSKTTTLIVAQPPKAGDSAFKTIKLEMIFEGTFPQLLNFLEKLHGLERIVVVDEISVERKKEILPYQIVSLRLITYTLEE